MAPGMLYQPSGSSLHSRMNASQIRDGPFNLWRRVGFSKYWFAILMRKHVRTCVRAYGYLRACLIIPFESSKYMRALAQPSTRWLTSSLPRTHVDRRLAFQKQLTSAEFACHTSTYFASRYGYVNTDRM